MPLNFSSKYKEEHLKYISEATFFENVFSKDDLQQLENFMYHRVAKHRYSGSGNLLFSGNFKELYEIIKPKIENFVDLSLVDSVGGNFFHTPHPYGVHTDMPEKGGDDPEYKIPYKNILIPIYKILPENQSRIVYFKPRVVDHGTIFNNTKDIVTYTHYNEVVDYTLVKNVYDSQKNSMTIGNDEMPKEEFVKHGLDKTVSPITRYRGIEVENSFPWQPGTISIFDPAQIHCSTWGDPKFKGKGGLRFALYRRADI